MPKTTQKLSHFNPRGAAHMVDVGGKSISHRRARAEGRILMHPTTLALILQGSHAKGDVLGIARVAGIMAAKKTADLIPLCHPLALTHLDINLEAAPDASAVLCTASVETHGITGVEMEALIAVQVTLATIYDMCKKVDRGMTLTGIQLLEKTGGESGHWLRSDA